MAAITPRTAIDELKWPNPVNRPDYTSPITNWDIPTHSLKSKFLPGDSPVAGTLSLTDMLLECWERDVHFTQYVTPNEVRCVKRGKYDTIFRLAVFDLDSHDIKPTLADYRDLQTTIIAMSGGGPGGKIPMPNIMYRTRGGARLIYIIKPVYDPNLYERSHAGLMDLLDILFNRLLNAGISKYKLDKQCKDWTRLFRAPLVCRDVLLNGKPTGRQQPPEYWYHIGQFHEQILNIETLAVPAKPQLVPREPSTKRTGNDHYLIGCFKRMVPGARNSETNSAFYHAYKNYAGEALAYWLNEIWQAALASELDECEISTIEASASKSA